MCHGVECHNNLLKLFVQCFRQTIVIFAKRNSFGAMADGIQWLIKLIEQPGAGKNDQRNGYESYRDGEPDNGGIERVNACVYAGDHCALASDCGIDCFTELIVNGDFQQSLNPALVT